MTSADVPGLLVLDKPSGLTSHDVVARVRRVLGTRRVGHAGTLDPMATGVLVLGVNRATRLLGHLTGLDKRYAATVRLGASTTTDDAEGEPLAEVSAAGVSEDAARSAAARLVGDLQQVPSAVSAVKVDGRRAYRRVRAGEQVELAARPVTVHALVVHEVRRSTPDTLDVDIDVHCSSGTYVRALARDLGEALGVGGHLVALRRTAVGPVGLDEAVPLAALEEAGESALQPLGAVVGRFFPVRELDAEQAADVGFGRPLELPLDEGRPTALLGPDGQFLALYRGTGAGGSRPVAVFV